MRVSHSIRTTCALLALALLAACGGGGGGGGGSAAPVLAFLAGDMGGQGNADGTGAAARFNLPQGIAVDGATNVYVSDTPNNTIRKITPAGVVTTLAGTPAVVGSSDGTGPAASFSAPGGLAVNGSGDVIVADGSNNLIRRINTAGVVSTLAGIAGQQGSTDATGTSASFRFPFGVATDILDNVFVADSGNHTIRKITSAAVVSTLAGTAGTTGSTDATGPAASFHSPAQIATDPGGTVYVADSQNNTIRKVTAAGVVTTLAGTAGQSGSADGTGAAARFSSPESVAVDAVSNVYVADTSNSTIRMITPGGVVTTLAGSAGQLGSTDATGAAARFSLPTGIAVTPAGTVYVADTFNQVIRKITPAGAVSTFAGSPPLTGSTEGAGAVARFRGPVGVAADPAGNAYVADSNNHTIRKVTPAGAVSTFAGTAGATGSADGTGALANFTAPRGVATDSAGNVYVADSSNHTIRKITPAGVVTTLAGSAGNFGSTDGPGVAARFTVPIALALDSAGNIYVADTQNHTIRKISPTAPFTVSTLAGAAGIQGNTDGTTTAARFNLPLGVAVDGAGNVYVSDSNNSTIRKITPGGVVTTFAGTAGSRGSADGTGAAARLNGPFGIASDSADNLYVADEINHIIRKITPAGVVSTVVGVAGQADFVPGSLPGRLVFPLGVAVSGASLYITMANGITVVQNRP